MNDDLLERLIALIAMDTRNPGGDEPQMAELLAGWLGSFRPDTLEVVAVPRPIERRSEAGGAYVWACFGEPRTLINIHIDTVPLNAGWTTDPLRAVITPERVTGLGSADTKGAIAALFSALGKVRPRDLGILFSGDEECGGSCTSAFLASPRRHGIERAIVCEPTACRIGTRHRGILAVEVNARGCGGHSSHADSMPKPFVDLARVALALDAYACANVTAGSPDFPGLCLNIAEMRGGVAFNVVPDAATLVFSARPAPKSDVAALHRAIAEIVGSVDAKLTLRTVLDKPPFATRHLEEFTPWFTSSRAPGAAPFAPLAIDLPYWTEAALFAEAGVDAVVFGPGDISQAHAPGEFVKRSDLELASDVFASVLCHSALGR